MKKNIAILTFISSLALQANANNRCDIKLYYKHSGKLAQTLCYDENILRHPLTYSACMSSLPTSVAKNYPAYDLVPIWRAGGSCPF